MPPVLQPAASCRCLPPLTAARGVDAHLWPCSRRPGGAATGRGGRSVGLFPAARVNWSLLEERHLAARATGQEVATIQSCRLLQCLTNSCHVLDLFRLRGSGKCPLKILDIEREDDLWSRLPLQTLSIGGHKMGGVRKRLAQLRQDLAQIGVGLGLS